MRTVTITPPGAQAVVIYDEIGLGAGNYFPDRCKGGFLPKRARQFQLTQLFRGAFPFDADRFNVYVNWDFEVGHTFRNYQAAQDFVGNRPYMAAAGEVQIITRGGGVSSIRYYKTAFLTQSEPIKEEGIRITFRYALLFNSAYSLTP